MTTVFSPFHEMSAEDFKRVTEVTYLRFVYGTMAALNTPQFSWCKSHLRRKAQLVPPIFQPEVSAEAVYWAAHQHHREVFVGWPTARAIWGRRFIAGILDHLVATLAWDGQLYDGAADHDWPVDLYAPIPGHQSGHGDFDSCALSSSWETQLTVQGSRLATAAANAAGVVVQAFTADRGIPESGQSTAQHAEFARR